MSYYFQQCLLLLDNGQYHVEDVFDHDAKCFDAIVSRGFLAKVLLVLELLNFYLSLHRKAVVAKRIRRQS